MASNGWDVWADSVHKNFHVFFLFHFVDGFEVGGSKYDYSGTAVWDDELTAAEVSLEIIITTLSAVVLLRFVRSVDGGFIWKWNTFDFIQVQVFEPRD